MVAFIDQPFQVADRHPFESFTWKGMGRIPSRVSDWSALLRVLLPIYFSERRHTTDPGAVKEGFEEGVWLCSGCACLAPFNIFLRLGLVVASPACLGGSAFGLEGPCARGLWPLWRAQYFFSAGKGVIDGHPPIPGLLPSKTRWRARWSLCSCFFFSSSLCWEGCFHVADVFLQAKSNLSP